MVSSKAISILNNARGQVSVVQLTEHEVKQVELLCELLGGILGNAARRSNPDQKASEPEDEGLSEETQKRLLKLFEPKRIDSPDLS